MLPENRLVLKATPDGIQLSRTQGQRGFPCLLTLEASVLGPRILQQAAAKNSHFLKESSSEISAIRVIAVLPPTLTLLRWLYLCYLLQESVELFKTMLNLSENAVLEQVGSHPPQ